MQDITVFTQHKMLAYRNGKSAGLCAAADWHGPHRFTGNYHVVPVAKACVLHFESCLYEQWRNKFIKHKAIDEQKKKDIPFPFYRDSITLFQVHNKAPQSCTITLLPESTDLVRQLAPSLSLMQLDPCLCFIDWQSDQDGGKDEERWKQFFMERKVGNFSDLKESEKVRLALSITMAPMINAA